MKIKQPILTFLGAIILSFNTYARSTQDLQNEILKMDGVLFQAFNSCNLKVMSEIFDQDLEFYHDKGGLTNYQDTLKASKRNCDNKLGLTRTLIMESNKIFPAGDFGAIQEGRHQFCHMENGKNDCGTFTFIHIWKKTEDNWTLSRIVSYDH